MTQKTRRFRTVECVSVRLAGENLGRHAIACESARVERVGGGLVEKRAAGPDVCAVRGVSSPPPATPGPRT